VFWLQGVKLASSLVASEHGGQVLLLGIDLELVESLAILSVHVVVGVDERLGLLELLVHTVINSADVSGLECLLDSAVSEQQVRRSADLHINQGLVVIFVLFIVLLKRLLLCGRELTKMSCWVVADLFALTASWLECTVNLAWFSLIPVVPCLTEAAKSCPNLSST